MAYLTPRELDELDAILRPSVDEVYSVLPLTIRRTILQEMRRVDPRAERIQFDALELALDVKARIREAILSGRWPEEPKSQ